MTEKIKIMFVCHGNICRSPMAEFIFRDMANKKGIADMFCIASSATSTEEIWLGRGNPVYPPAREILMEHGIDCTGKCATLLTKDDYAKYDLFVAMDNNNIRNIMHIFGSDNDGKVRKLMEYAGKSRDVRDPWYSGDFEEAYRDIYEGCEGLMNTLIK